MGGSVGGEYFYWVGWREGERGTGEKERGWGVGVYVDVDVGVDDGGIG